jgi:hypothetical protein
MPWILAILFVALAAMPAAADDATPRDIDVVLGDATTYRPVAQLQRGDVSVELPFSLRNRVEAVNDFPLDLDRDRTQLDENFFIVTQLRIGARTDWRPANLPFRLLAEYEHDLATGSIVGAPEVAGERLPNGEKAHNELRKLYGRLTLWDLVVVSGGFNTSHWGLGLLANDGAHGWTPGSARFSDPRSGDRVVRVSVGTVPLTEYGFVARVAWDDVRGDDVLLEGDSANQYIFSALAGEGKSTAGGIYLVYRDQDSKTTRGFHVFVADVTASTSFKLGSVGTLTLAGEGALIDGRTSLGPNSDFARHDIFQLGGVLRASLDCGGHGGVFDILYASGDQNLDDPDNNAFKVDPNHELGLLLFRQVVAGQTGRAPVTAGNLDIVGRAVPDLDRVPTGGSPTNTIAFFPRAWWRPRDGLEAYGGPLFALTEVKNTDPFNTRLAGGDPRNPLNGDPGNFWGTELDLGVRYHALLDGSEVTLGIEFGTLFPGSAFRDAAGNRMNEVVGGRFMMDYRL